MSTPPESGRERRPGRTPEELEFMEYTRLYLIRHGQVVGHEEMRFNGHSDVDLTPVGIAQMEAAAEDVRKVDFQHVYSSDLKRARYGGEAIVRERDLTLQVDSGFRELGFGDWEGMSFDEIEAQYPGALEERRKNMVHYRPPGAETIGEFWARVRLAGKDLIERHRGQTVCLVAHSGVNRVILLEALGCGPEMVWRIHQDFGCLNMIDYYEEDLAIIRLANGPNRVQGEPVQGM